MSPITESIRTREQRLRRAAGRQDLRLEKSRRRDPRAPDHGGWMILDLTGAVIAGTDERGRPSWSLDQVERYLDGER
jgi:hypothetical protein